MHRTASVALVLLVLSLASCAPISGSVVVSSPAPPPSYVYAYPDGSCWADDLWYASCPWYFGPQSGYYYYQGGSYYWEPRAVWRIRIHQPPPYRWRHRYHDNRHHRIVVPRDHRRRR